MSEIISTFTSTDWTREGMIDLWTTESDDDMTPELAAACADHQLAFLINYDRTWLPAGWAFSSKGMFSGPHKHFGPDPVEAIETLITTSIDHVVEIMDEIKADLEAEQA